MDLLTPLLGTNLRVYMDNYFNSVALLCKESWYVVQCNLIGKGYLHRFFLWIWNCSEGSSGKPKKMICLLAFGWTQSWWLHCPVSMIQPNKAQCCGAGSTLAHSCQYRECYRITRSTCEESTRLSATTRWIIDQRSGGAESFFMAWWFLPITHMLWQKDEGHAYHREQWPTFLDFLEDLASELVGDTRTDRVPPLVRCPERSLQTHTLERMYAKRRECRECSLSSVSGERAQATNYGCKECSVPLHQKCVNAHINSL